MYCLYDNVIMCLSKDEARTFLCKANFQFCWKWGWLVATLLPQPRTQAGAGNAVDPDEVLLGVVGFEHGEFAGGYLLFTAFFLCCSALLRMHFAYYG